MRTAAYSSSAVCPFGWLHCHTHNRPTLFTHEVIWQFTFPPLSPRLPHYTADVKQGVGRGKGYPPYSYVALAVAKYHPPPILYCNVWWRNHAVKIVLVLFILQILEPLTSTGTKQTLFFDAGKMSSQPLSPLLQSKAHVSTVFEL